MKKPYSVRSIILAGSLLLQLNTFCFQSRGAPGDVDLSFDPGSGINGSVSAAAIQPDGKVIIGGYFTTVKGVASRDVARLNADGTGDSGFKTGELYALISSSLALQPDGKVLVGHYYGIARLNSDGSSDTNFHATATAIYYENGSIYAASVDAVAVQSDGKVLIGGDFTSINGTNRNRIARLNGDGSVDSTFDPGTGANQRVTSVVLQPDGRVLIGGSFCTANGTNLSCGIARLNSNGSLDSTFNTGATSYGTLFSIALQSDGKVLIGGDFGIVRLNSNGSPDSTFNPGTGASSVKSVKLQPDGKVLIAGNFTTVNGTNRNRIARLNSNGGLDTSYNPGTGADNTVNTLVLQSDGKALIGGDFITVNRTNRSHFARINGNGSLDVGFDPGTGAIGGDFYTIARSIILQPDGKVLAGGYFDYVSGTNANHEVARLNANGSLDLGFNPGIGALDAYSLALQSDGKVLVGYPYGVARLNSDGSLASNAVITSGYDYIGAASFAVQTDGKVLVGGYFVHSESDGLGGYIISDIPFLTRLNGNGSSDASFNPGTGPNFIVNSIAIQADGKVLIGGGYPGTTGIVRLNSNGSLDGSFNPGTGIANSANSVNSIAVQSDGKILIGGDFTSFNGINRNEIARLNSNGSLDSSFDPGTGVTGSMSGTSGVNDVVLQPDGRVLIGGYFTTVNGANRNRIARLNGDGSLDSSFNPGTGANGVVTSVALQPDGSVLIGGNFTTINGVVRPYVARLYGDSPAPSLNIARSNALVIVSWPATGLNLQLLQSTNLSLPNSWTPVAQSAVTNAGQISVTVPTTAGRKFFRLKSQ